MKTFICVFVSMTLLLGCKKDSNLIQPASKQTSEQSYLNKVNALLKKKLTVEDYSRIDLPKANISLINNNANYFIRVPFKNAAVKTDFIALQTDTLGNFDNGKIIHYEIPDTLLPANKKVLITDFDRTKTWMFNFLKPSLKEAKSEVVIIIPLLDDVTIVCYLPNPSVVGSFTQFSLDNINFLLNPSSATQTSNGIYGVPPAGNTSGNFGTYSNYMNNANGIVNKIEFERPENEPAADINKIFKCFDAVPDAGATYQVTINADIPVNSDPLAPFNFKGSPGHSFITIVKINGANSVTKSYGFYPSSGTKSIVDPYGYVSSKIVNNSQHEFNSSITKSITQTQFNTIKNTSITNATTKNYSIGLFNCTDYALAAYNSAFTTTNKIVLIPFAVTLITPTIPVTVLINNSPQMLYKYTSLLMDDISLPPGVKLGTGNAPNSPGECN